VFLTVFCPIKSGKYFLAPYFFLAIRIELKYGLLLFGLLILPDDDYTHVKNFEKNQQHTRGQKLT
jgi:hypothetical protein